MPSPGISAILQACPLTQGCAFAPGALQLRHFRKGQLVTDWAGDAPAVGVVGSGQVDVYHMARDGRQVRLSSLGAGECFGVYNLFEDEQMETVLKCRQAADILFIPKALFLHAARHDAALALRLAQFYAGKVRFLLGRIESLTLGGSRARLASYLLAHAGADGMVHPAAPREVWAKTLGVSRAALYRELAHLRQAGYIALQGRSVQVLSRPALAALLE